MMHMRVMATAALTLWGSAVFAQEACLSIADDNQRLACYDEANGYEPVQPEPIESAWRIEREADPLTDRTNIYISVTANETARCGYETIRPTLYLRCMDNTTAALLVTGCFMADIQGYGRVSYRVDDGAMKRRNFTERTDNMALGLWSFGRSTPFIRDLMGGERLIMEYTPYNDIEKVSTFDITGIDDALAPLREECGW